MYQQRERASTPAETIEQYTPRGLNPRQWTRVRAFVTDAVTRGEPASTIEARLLMSDAARLATWAHCVAGHPLTIEAIFDRDLISEWAELSTAEVKPAVAVLRRGRMKRLAEKINSAHHDAVQPEAPFTRRWHPRPYSRQEVLEIEDWAASQRTEKRRIHAAVLLGLTLGCGLQSAEIVQVRAADLTCDDDGVLVRVVGARSRIIPVRARYEAALRDAATHLVPDDYVFVPGRTRDHASVVANVIGSTTRESGIRPDPWRLRATWIAGLIQSNVPVEAVLQAAGLTSLGRYRCAQAVPGCSAEEVSAWLRGGNKRG